MPSSIYSLPTRLRDGAGLVTGWLSIPDPLVAGHMAQEAFDCLVLDMQHGHYEFKTAALGIGQAALRGVPVIVRIPVGDYAMASRLLDAGAAGIIAPMINSVADARALVAYTKYQPLGERSWGPALALNMNGLPAAEQLKTANGLTLAIPMIETANAVAALDDILAVEGVGGVFLGPYDLSIALTQGGPMNAQHPAVISAMEKVVARCRVHGKAAMVMGATGERAAELIAMGFDLVAVGPDNILLREASRTAIATAKRGTQSATR
ncbi:MAG TPA: aldolase/citrate lyase family protein [Bauldia sp.]|nr:aldolase/citrate lyase family protein [Bauldia sp.]